MTVITAHWLTEARAQRVFSILVDAGFKAYAVGGCVRNELLGAPIRDVDFCTDAPPETVTKLTISAGLHVVPTGIDHGTVTLVVDGQGFEVTTFRRDVETDGRRAVVAYAKTMQEDASRRDFTMNALYVDRDGTVHDPLGGIGDLFARRVVFVGDAETRIREDVLRILRFFRFHAWYGDPAAGLDADGLAACAAHSGELETLSAERVGAEIVKLLGAPDPAPAVAAMVQAGVLGPVLPGADAKALPLLVHFEGETGAAPDAILRLASLGGEGVSKRLRLSRAEARKLTLYRVHMASAMGALELGYRFGAEDARGVLLLRAAQFETPPNPGDQKAADRGAAAEFPVRAADLMPDLKGPALGARLALLETEWLASDLKLGREALLALP